jgi:hypothetical protein
MIMHRRRRLVPALTILVCLCGASPASAGSVAVDTFRDRLVFTAASGERNGLTVTGTAGTYTLEDSGAPIAAGRGCTQLASNRVLCAPVPGGPIQSLAVAAGDTDDSFASSAALRAWVDGGAGADTLRGGAASDQLLGGDGDDLLDGGFGPDIMSGGNGRDRADYSARTAPVFVSLDSLWGDGQLGEWDNVSSSVEDLTGGSAGDRLTGGSSPNQLAGGAGADRLTGGDGNDLLEGGPGIDALAAGSGDDGLSARDGEVDDVACGAGQDTTDVDAGDKLAEDCERAVQAPAPHTGEVTLERTPRSVRLTPKGYVRIRISCPATAVAGCSGRLTVSVLGRGRTGVSASAKESVGKGRRFSLKAGESEDAKVKISRNGRRRVLQKKRAKCRVSVHTPAATGERVTARKTITVKAPRQGRKS